MDAVGSSETFAPTYKPTRRQSAAGCEMRLMFLFQLWVLTVFCSVYAYVACPQVERHGINTLQRLCTWNCTREIDRQTYCRARV
jgi:hypothetical protein